MGGFDRSVRATLDNDSDLELVRDELVVDGGKLAPEPPERVAPRKAATWFTSQDGFMEGVEGRVTYRVGATGAKLVVRWNNPFVGDNEFSQRVEGPALLTAHGRYRSFDPMQPHGRSERPYAPHRDEVEALRDDEEVAVRYRFALEPAPAARPLADAPAAPPVHRGPQATTVPSGARASVRDAKAGYRKTVYVGLNPSAVTLEHDTVAGALAKAEHAPTFKKEMAAVHAIKLGSAQERQILVNGWGGLEGAPTDFWGRLESLPEAARRRLAEDDTQARSVTTRLHRNSVVHPPTSPARRVVRAALAELFAEVTRELERIDEQGPTGAQPMKRLVLSGHHWPKPGDYFPPLDAEASRPEDLPGRGVLWGDDGHAHMTRLLDFFEDFGVLARLFPRAAAQVEDLHLSACATGIHSQTAVMWGTEPLWRFLDDPRVLTVFPNLQTVWACESVSQLCPNQLKAWAIGVAHPTPETELVRIARVMRTKPPNRHQPQAGQPRIGTIAWIRKGSKLVPDVDADPPAG